MRVLVTGATGFLGGALIRRLLDLGHSPTALGRNRERGRELEVLGIPFLAVDLADREAMVQSCRGQDWVVHCAALSSPWGRPRAFFEANVVGTDHLIQGCLRAGVQRLVHVSTPSIYINGQNRFDIREGDPLPLRPINAYARSKAQAEALIDFAAAGGLPAITLRPQALYGPGDQTLLPRLIRVAQRGSFPVIGTGQNLVDLTFVENAVDALLLALEGPAAALGGKFNITDGSPVHLYDTLMRVFMALNIPVHPRRVSRPFARLGAMALEGVYRWLPGYPEPPLTRYGVGVLSESRTLCIAKARAELGYVPRFTTDEGLGIFLKHWKEGAWG
jgi:nucleoside-diphosphate-sugar epimerase